MCLWRRLTRKASWTRDLFGLSCLLFCFNSFAIQPKLLDQIPCYTHLAEGDFDLFAAYITLQQQIDDLKIRAFYFDRFSDPNYRAALADIGKSREPFPFQARLLFRNILVALAPLISKLPSELGSEILLRASLSHRKALEKLKPGQIKRLDYLDGSIKTNWDGPKILQQLKSFADRIREARPTLDWDELKELKPSARLYIEDNFFLYPSKISRLILARLITYDWFMRYSPSNQAKVYFVLNYAAYIAETTQSQLQKELLTNTINLVLNRRWVIEMSPLGSIVAGQTDGKTIWLNREAHSVRALGMVTENSKYLALEVMPHEASHVLSQTLPNENVEYFEEETRAWVVGFVGLNGRIPMQSEILNRVAHSLVPLKPPGLYPAIANAWKKDPASFYSHLKELGFKDPIGLVNLGHMQFLTVGQVELSDQIPAPLWGWPGFLTNQDKR